MSEAEHDFLVLLADNTPTPSAAEVVGWLNPQSVRAKVYNLLSTLGIAPQGSWAANIEALRTKAQALAFHHEALYGIHNREDSCECVLCVTWFGPLVNR